MNAPVYCEMCGNIMLISENINIDHTWNEQTGKYDSDTTQVNFLLCPVCEHRIPQVYFDQELTEEQKGGVEEALK